MLAGVLEKYPTYERNDEAHFIRVWLTASLRDYTIVIKRYPKSKFTPWSYAALARHYAPTDVRRTKMAANKARGSNAARNLDAWLDIVIAQVALDRRPRTAREHTAQDAAHNRGLNGRPHPRVPPTRRARVAKRVHRLGNGAMKTVDVDGCSLAYWREGGGETILFVQGTGVHGAAWKPQVAALPGYDRIWFDNRGMGKSQPRGAAPITVEQMAKDALAVLDDAGVERAHVVGHSLGGCIALELALQATERVASLALMCTAADGPGLVKMTWPTLWRGVRTMIGTLRSRRAAFLENVLTPSEHTAKDLDQTAAELEPLFGHDLGKLPSVAMKQVSAMGKWNVEARLGELKALPVLVMGADQDVIARPPLMRSLAEGLDKELVLLENAAHGVPLTNPARVNAIFGDFLTKAAGGSS